MPSSPDSAPDPLPPSDVEAEEMADVEEDRIWRWLSKGDDY